ncbi:MAG TPA: TetR family transcriptional regulator C-terminal domain-containing protein, partial [Ktedonobacteraceae bacterium]|nr:TetR family transcriptional regulator C-terminal domain-containing protein [Ktedonobacteraceae bacterium]
YWYFKSKEDIIIAISQRLFSMDIEQLEGMLKSGGTVGERLLQLMNSRAQGLLEMSAVITMLFEFYAAALHQDEVRRVIQEYFRGFHAVLVTLIQQGIDRGEFRLINVEEAATTLASLFEGLVVRWLIDPQAVQWDTLIESSVRLFLDGLRM